MKQTVRSRSTRLAIVAVAVVLAGAGGLTACASGGTEVARVFGGFTNAFTADEKSAESVETFRQLFDQYAKRDSSRNQQLRHFRDAYLRVRQEYVQSIDDAVLIKAAVDGVKKLEGKPGTFTAAQVTEAALDGMLTNLDPHSSYLNPDEFRESQVTTRGEFGGLGIEVNMEDGFVKVIAPIEDTPASRAGIKSGDLITHVDGTGIKGMSLIEAVRLLRGKPKTDVRLTIRRAGAGEFDVTVTRAIIRVRPIKWSIEGDVGVIRIVSFNQRADDEMRRAVSAIRRKLGGKLRGFVLDLRNNPGGLLSQSVAVTDSFLDRGDIVSVRDRDGNGRAFNAETGDLADGLPIVVLINRGSASASEILAGALQDQNRATVIGARSFGKGSVQTITPLDWDGALRLTTALYYLPSGRSIQGSGVEPDIIITGGNGPPHPRRGDFLDRLVPGKKKEADLPHALQVEKHQPKPAQAKIRLDDCPGAGTGDKDRMLGCAVTLINDGGSEAKFLARFGSRTKL